MLTECLSIKRYCNQQKEVDCDRNEDALEGRNGIL